MKVLWVLYLIAGAPQSLGEFYTKEDCRKALELATAESFGTVSVGFICVPYLASSYEGQP